MNMKKRSLFSKEYFHEVKKSKLAQKTYGDGVSWFRGPMIGKGSYACVFVATLKNLESRYSLYPPIMAVKSATVSASSSVQKEKEVMDNIRGCSYIIECFGEEITTGDNGQMVYNLLLEYGSGGTLADQIRKTKYKGLPEPDVKRYTRSILRGLTHVHKQGYVHCDLKPQNVILVANDEGRRRIGDINQYFTAKIGDFGLAKRRKKNDYDTFWRGTPMYLSPEAVMNGVQEQPADIWGVGCIVFEMLTGKQLCFPNQNAGIIGDENKLFSAFSGISAGGRSFLKKCLSINVNRRLTANMLLNHPFLQGLPDDDINEVEESQEAFDQNSITSSSSFSDDDDDDGLWDEEDVDVITIHEDNKNNRWHEVQIQIQC